jgi:hypothetical protein
MNTDMSKDKEIQDLLKPRIKVISPYPEMERHYINVGDILTDNGKNECVRDQNGNPRFTFEWEAFPHIFQKLEWWRDRKESEMPNYLKLRGQNWVFKPIEYLLPYDVLCPDEKSVTFKHQLQNFLPATEEEYNSYISKLNQ